jgi:hypothetical protein
LEFEKSYEIIATDRSTNLANPPEVPNNLAVTQTGGLEKRLIIKKNAPVVITSNHHISKYKEDGIVNGARGFVDSIQVSKLNSEKVEVIWIVFKDPNVGRLLRYDNNHLKKIHKPNNEKAVPIIRERKKFYNQQRRGQISEMPVSPHFSVCNHILQMSR